MTAPSRLCLDPLPVHQYVESEMPECPKCKGGGTERAFGGRLCLLCDGWGRVDEQLNLSDFADRIAIRLMSDLLAKRIPKINIDVIRNTILKAGASAVQLERLEGMVTRRVVERA